MKRFHVHMSVSDLTQGIAFYSRLFGAAPSVQKDDYAKWMLDDPRVNFAISSRGAAVGVNHLGFQVDTAEELTAMRQQVRSADLAVEDEAGASCCYARSDKYWITDPAGMAWETFQTLGEIPVFGAAREAATASAQACCPSPAGSAGAAPASACCG